MSTAAAVLAVFLELPTYHGDKNDPPDTRIALYAPYAQAIADTAKNERETAVLMSIAWHESHLARYILENRCSEGPVGERCDNGRARNFLQIHRVACPDAWKLPWGSDESLRLEAQCAISLYHFGEHRCRSASGAYGIYAGTSCAWSGSVSRHALSERLQRRLVIAERRLKIAQGVAMGMASGAD